MKENLKKEVCNLIDTLDPLQVVNIEVINTPNVKDHMVYRKIGFIVESREIPRSDGLQNN